MVSTEHLAQKKRGGGGGDQNEGELKKDMMISKEQRVVWKAQHMVWRAHIGSSVEWIHVGWVGEGVGHVRMEW